MLINEIPIASDIINAVVAELRVTVLREGDTVARVGNLRSIDGTNPDTAEIVISDSMTTFRIPLIEAIKLRQEGAFAIWK